jgi:hypothetical protein
MTHTHRSTVHTHILPSAGEFASKKSTACFGALSLVKFLQCAHRALSLNVSSSPKVTLMGCGDLSEWFGYVWAARRRAAAIVIAIDKAAVKHLV